MTTNPLEIAGIPQLEEWSSRTRAPKTIRIKGPDQFSLASDEAKKARENIAEQVKPPVIVESESSVEILAGPGITVGRNGNQFTIGSARTQRGNSMVECPVKGIIMYSGTDAELAQWPDWKLCNGANGTPDLSDKFIVASSSYSSGWKSTVEDPDGTDTAGFGGSKTHNHDDHDGHTHDIGTHTHDLSNHTHDTSPGLVQGNDGSGSAWSAASYAAMTSGGPSTNATGQASGATGGVVFGEELDHSTERNIPPYYVLAFIMRIQ